VGIVFVVAAIAVGIVVVAIVVVVIVVIVVNVVADGSIFRCPTCSSLSSPPSFSSSSYYYSCGRSYYLFVPLLFVSCRVSFPCRKPNFHMTVRGVRH
jgi:hypothetical protein